MDEDPSTSALHTPRGPMGAGLVNSRLKAKSKAVNDSPATLHDVILDYITTNGYLSTALCLVEPEADAPAQKPKRPLPLDGDIVMDTSAEPSSPVKPTNGSDSHFRRLDKASIEAIERRHHVLDHILNGAISKAIEALNTHYPAVLDLTIPSWDPMFGASLEHRDGTGTNGTHHNGNGISNGSGHVHTVTTNNTTNNGNGNGSNSANRYAPDPTPHWLYGTSSANDAGTGANPRGSTQSGSTPGTGSSATASATTAPFTTINHAIPTFPQSSNPSHLLLNLHIQQFIESFRHLSSDTASPSSSMSSSLTASMSMSMSMSNGSGGTLTHALTAASGLHAEAAKLDPAARSVYVREITEAGALFAYTDPEQSPVGGFLKQERRIALADQVNRAILRSQGMPDWSVLEYMARRTTASFSILESKGIDPRPPFTGPEAKGKEELAKWWKTQNKGFKFRDFVSQAWA